MPTLAQVVTHGSVVITAMLCVRAVCLRHASAGVLRALWVIVLAFVVLPLPAVITLDVGVATIAPDALDVMPKQDGSTVITAPPDHSVLASLLGVPAMLMETPAFHAIWLAGACAFGTSLTLSVIRTSRIIRSASPCTHQDVARWVRTHSGRRMPRVLESSRVHTPLSAGVFRPVIVLPAGFAERHGTRARYALLHELTHIRRLDPALKIGLLLTACLFWFNPFVWLMLRAASQDMELACDEAVMARLRQSGKTRYLTLLIDVARGRAQSPSVAVTFGASPIRTRVMKALQASRAPATRAVTDALAILCVVTACLCAVRVVPGALSVCNGTYSLMATQSPTSLLEITLDGRVTTLRYAQSDASPLVITASSRAQDASGAQACLYACTDARGQCVLAWQDRAGQHGQVPESRQLSETAASVTSTSHAELAFVGVRLPAIQVSLHAR